MKFSCRPSKTRRIDFAAWGISLILALLFTLYGIADRRALLKQAGQDAKVIAGQTALAAEGTLDSTRQLLRGIKILAGSSHSDDEIRTTLLDWKAGNQYIMDLLIVSPDGVIRHWSGSGTPPRIDDREYYRVHLATNDSPLYVGLPLLSKIDQKKWFFAVSEAIRDTHGGLKAVVIAVIDISLLKDHLAAPMAGAGSTQVLAGLDGTIYARHPDHELFVGKKVSPGDVTTGRAEIIKGTPFVLTSPLDGKKRIAAVKPLSNYPLVAAGSRYLDDVFAEWRERLLIVVALWLGITLSALWIARRFKADLRLQEQLANTDGLTGIHNRRAILSAASDMEQADHGKGKLSLLMIDVDHFKQVNDKLGHQAGDAVLRRIADVLRRQCRNTDIVGRYGGEEFLVLMPDTGTEGAASVAEKLRAAVEATRDVPAPVTISIGIATTGTDDHSLQQTLIRADGALYAAKAAGRNCIRHAEN